MPDAEIQGLRFNGESAWDKCSGGTPRRWRLRLLDLQVRALGESAHNTEARRVAELATIS